MVSADGVCASGVAEGRDWGRGKSKTLENKLFSLESEMEVREQNGDLMCRTRCRRVDRVRPERKNERLRKHPSPSIEQNPCHKAGPWSLSKR